MDAKVSQLLNEQINKEFYSAYLYLDMANWYDTKGLDGFSNWFEIQAKEEQDHAMLMYQYLHNNDQTVTLEAIAKPDKVYGELIDPLKAAYEHEQFVTASIHTIYAAAKAAGSTPPPRPPTISAPCSFSTGSSRSRARRRRTPPISSRRWSSSAPTREGSICSIRSSPRASTAPRRSCFDRETLNKSSYTS